MGAYDVNNLSEQKFDALLQEGLSELPPDDVVYEVTPWRKAINRILTGFALTAITLNFFGLNYLLPIIGMFLSLLGFRTLRNENGWFRTCYILTVIRCAYFFPMLVLKTTIFQSNFIGSTVVSILDGIHMILLFLLYIYFWKALRAVKQKAGLEPYAGGAAALIGWNAFVCAWGLLQIPGSLILGIILLIAYICIIRSLIRLSRELDEAGYCVCGAPVKFTDRAIVVAVTLALLIGCAGGYAFFSRYPMEWEPVSHAETEQAEQIKEHLISLGFPAHIADDLTQEDLLSCKDAIRVVVEVQDYPVNPGRQVQEPYGNSFLISTVYDQKELRLTGIGVELPGEREQWKIIHHFQWVIDPGFYGTEVIQLWPAYRIDKGWLSSSEVTGQVLYNDGDQVYSAPYFSLGKETYTADNTFLGAQTSTDIFAEFSMPRKGENHRGYVSYTIEEAQDGWLLSAWVNYTHQTTWLQYPAITAKQKVMTSGSWSTRAFKIIQDALQFFPNDEELEPLHGSEE